MKYQEYRPASQFLKLIDGENKVRLVSEAEQFVSEYQGKESTRFVAYVVDRVDGGVKPLTFGSSIMGQIAALANHSEYGFESLPTYDIFIHKTGSGLGTEYKLTPSKKDTLLTSEEQKAVDELKPIAELAKKLSKKVVQGEHDTTQPPVEAYDQDGGENIHNIPF